MRPGDFSPGNGSAVAPTSARAWRCFNEAGGFLPRKRPAAGRRARCPGRASMRPGDFSPGNMSTSAVYHQARDEASMRPGDFSPGNLP